MCHKDSTVLQFFHGLQGLGDIGRNEEGNRCICADDQLAFASLEAATFKEETKNVRDLIYNTTIEEGNALKSLEMIYNMIKRAEDSYERKFLQRRKLALMSRIDELRKLETESEASRYFLLWKNIRSSLSLAGK
jgi:hypothetical protein